MDALLHDLKQGIRALARNPAFTGVAILTLALGIGANTAIFSVVDAVLMRPLPYGQPDRIVLGFSTQLQRGVERTGVSAIDYTDWRDQNDSFAATALYGPHGFTLTGVDEPEDIPALIVSASFFDVLGIEPEYGRAFSPEETVLGSHQVVVVSHGLWERRFGADPGLVGSTLVLSDQPYTVVGIMPAGFRFPNDNIGFWAPFPFPLDRSSRGERWLGFIGRLDDEVAIEPARAELQSIAARLAAEYPDTNSGWGADVAFLHDVIVSDLRPALLAFQVAIGLVLLIACANVANLLLVRLSARRQEVALRAALGSSPGRLTRQLLAESSLVAISGGILGLLLATWGVGALLALLPAATPEDSHDFVALTAEQVGVSGSMFGFALLVSALAGLMAGVLPAWRMRSGQLTDYLKGGQPATATTAGAGSGRRLRDLVASTEVALALVLLVGAGLMTRSFSNLVAVDPGFRTDNVLTFRLGLSSGQYWDAARRVAFYDEVVGALEGLPGVVDVGASTSLPLGGVDWNTTIAVADRPAPPTGWPDVRFHSITPGYFEALAIPLAAGRSFTSRDDAEAPRVAMINETMARQLWPEADAVGKKLTMAQAPDEHEIVGIVADSHQRRLDTAVGPEVYVIYTQRPSFFMDFVVHSAAPPLDLVGAVRDRVWSIDENLPVANVGTMGQLISRATATQRMSMLLAGALGAVALALAGIGIYAVISYGVGQRRREIGIRRTLGAEGTDLFRAIIGQNMVATGLGIAAGLAIAMAGSRFMAGFLFGVGATDPLTLAVAAVLVAAVALVACALPARRAVGVDPIVVLRND